MDIALIQGLQQQGLQVYMRHITDTFAYFTDGIYIGYVQWGKGHPEYTSVHRPNHQVGTGFKADDADSALNMFCPHWAPGSGSHVQKWESWEAFHNANEWNRGYGLVVLPENV